jgi:DNA helicase-2/ATP-dependent DNA helicase PcrA
MVLAGAGSGKTKVLTTRAAWLLRTGQVTPHQLLLVTFTNKAAQEMNERLVKLAETEVPMSGTFHRIGVKLLRKHGHLLGIPRDFVILDSDDQLDAIKQLYRQHNWSEKEYQPRAVRNAISNAKNNMVSPSEYAKVAKNPFEAFAATVYGRYEAFLKENQALDFDDLLVKVITLFQAFPAVLERYQQQFHHVLVDEYQDTNTAQYWLTQQLSLPHKNLYVVGDFSQAIYSWRGADYRNMLALKDDFPELKEYRLERNYRSTQTILDAATAVISNNVSHPILNLWTDEKSDDQIMVFEAASGEDEANQIVHAIITRDLAFEYKDRAILYRTNAQSRAFEEALIRASIPYRLVGGIRFYARKEVKDLLAYLRLVTNPKDELARERVMKLGKRKFLAFSEWRQAFADQYLADLQTTIELQGEVGPDGELTVPEQAPVGLKTIPHPGEILEKILDASGYRARFSLNDPEDVERLENIQELLSFAQQFSSITDFLEHVALVQSDELANQNNPDLNSVTLMSIHAAKGLEFGIVYLAGLEEGLFPHSQALVDPKQMEEERRLCYVAITRAKSKLYLSYARRRLQYGRVTGGIPSRFLSEIPEKLLKYHQSTLNNNRSWMPDNHQFTQGKVKSLGEGRKLIIDDDALDNVLEGNLDLSSYFDS